MKAMFAQGITKPGAGTGGKTSHHTHKHDGDTKKKTRCDTNPLSDLSIATDELSQVLDDILSSPPALPDNVASMESDFNDNDVDIDGSSL